MSSRNWLIAITAAAFAAAAGGYVFYGHSKPAPATTSASAYANPKSCIPCHRDEAAAYNETGMGHSFYVPNSRSTVSTSALSRTYFHQASQTWYSLVAHDGRFFQRRWQKGFEGRDENVEELSIDYVMGSGNKVRTYLHREQDGTLIELPLAWYAENGGAFAMNPGFDNATPMTRRVIAYECMFCHNGYPEIPATAHRDLSAKPIYTSLPAGIDCQRCHGPGAAHVQAAEATAPDTARIHATILNPAHLSNERQMEVCEQCHLETTSTLLPDRVRHYDQQPFGYDPRQPLPAFNAYFTRSKPSADVEIVNSAFRLRQSQCFMQSKGALTCETCHNPHDLHKGPQSAQFFASICMNCHASQMKQIIAAKKHTDSNQCVTCHMPQRRTSDVIHAVMTDHLIQRRAPPASEALAPRQEATTRYNGPVVRYLLDGETPRPDDALYNAVAQVIDQSDLAEGTPALAAILEAQHPTEPALYIELGDAERHNNSPDAALAAYRKALALDPQSSRAARRLGVALAGSGQINEAEHILREATKHDPANEYLFYELAQVEARSGDASSAIADLRKALAIRPDYADALNNLGSLLAESGNADEAESQLRAALAANPYDADAHANLARLLNARGDTAQAAFQLSRATELAPRDPGPRIDHAILLLSAGKLSLAEAEVHAALQLDPHSARALDLSGQILLEKHQARPALAQFEAAAVADPGFSPAQLDVAETMIELGDVHGAIPWLEKAGASRLPAVSQRAHALLQQIHSTN